LQSILGVSKEILAILELTVRENGAMQSEDHAFETEPWRAHYLQDWSRLPVGLRRHLARIAPREAFQLLLGETNDQVLEAFLEHAEITQAEVLLIIERCRSAHLLDRISRSSKWYANHMIKRRLLSNPLLPPGVASRILDYLPFVELRRVMQNVNLSRDIRNKAAECFRKAFARISDADTSMLFLSTEGRVLRELSGLSPKDKRVLLDLMRRPNIPRMLVLNLAKSAFTPTEVLHLIAQNPTWTMNTSIRLALLANAKTPQTVKELLKGKTRPAGS
jgi:hypothetical protein